MSNVPAMKGEGFELGPRAHRHTERWQVRMEDQLASSEHAAGSTRFRKERTSWSLRVRTVTYAADHTPILVPIKMYCWAGKVTKLLKWFLCSHRCMSVDPQNLCKNPGVVVMPGSSVPGRQHRRIPGSGQTSEF